MSELPSDYLPPVGFESDKRGELPPATTIQFTAPRRLTRDITLTGLASGEERILTLIDEITDEMVEDAVRRARQRLFALRLERMASANDIMFRQVQLTDYADMRYVSQQNMEQVTITIGPRPVSEERVREELDKMCLLVFHSGNRLAAFDMKGLPDGKFIPAYKKALNQSSWGADPLLTTQYRYEKGVTAVFCPLNFSKDAITSESVYCLSRTVDKKSKETLAESVRSRTPRFDDVQNALNGDKFCTYDPWIVNTGSTFYTPYDVFSISDAGISFVRNGAAKTGASHGDYTSDQPFVVDRNGNYWYSIGEGYSFVRSDLFPSAQPRHWHLDFYKPVGVSQSIASAAGAAVPDYDYLEYVGHYKNTTTLVSTAYVNAPSVLGPWFWSDDDASIDTPLPEYSMVDGVDIIDAPLYNVRCTFAGIDPTDGNLGPSTNTITIGDVTVVRTFSGAPTDQTLQSVVAWPPAPQGSKYVIVTTMDGSSNYSGVLHTPYGTFPIETPYANGFGYLTYPRFQPRLHVSNGKHVLQGFVVTADVKFFLDGSDIGGKLATACGCSVDDIQSVLMDIPLNRIMQFK